MIGTNWSETVFLLGTMLLGTVILIIALAAFIDYRKAKLGIDQVEGLRQLVQRYEMLAENTMDAQQRTAADLSDLRSRTASIEQILRTVE